MFNGINRSGNTENLMTITVKDKRITYKITAVQNSNGKYDVLVYKNNKFSFSKKNVAITSRGANKSVLKTAAFYNMENNLKRLAHLNERQEMIEKRHQEAIRKRDNK